MKTCAVRAKCERLSSMLDRQFDEPAVYRMLIAEMCGGCQREPSAKPEARESRPEEVVAIY